MKMNEVIIRADKARSHMINMTRLALLLSPTLMSSPISFPPFTFPSMSLLFPTSLSSLLP